LIANSLNRATKTTSKRIVAAEMYNHCWAKNQQRKDPVKQECALAPAMSEMNHPLEIHQSGSRVRQAD
jgi:hypothetical protein